MSIRRLFPLFLLVVLSLTLMTYQSNKGPIAPFRFLSNPLNYLNDLIHSVSASLKEPFRRITVRDEEMKKLKGQIEGLLLEQQRYRDLFLENQRLREMLSLKERERRYVATARIISRGPDPWSNTLVIGKGTREGIAKDMAAVTPLGLVGKVTVVTDHYAYILLVTDINFSAAVRIQDTRNEALHSEIHSRRDLDPGRRDRRHHRI